MNENNGRTAGRRSYGTFDKALPGALADDAAASAA